MVIQGKRCRNFNHGRPNAPVRFCPTCGEVVNEGIPSRKCNEQEHAKRRRERNKYCVQCGEQLREMKA
jgi:rRNA maturation protein Nop10